MSGGSLRSHGVGNRGSSRSIADDYPVPVVFTRVTSSGATVGLAYGAFVADEKIVAAETLLLGYFAVSHALPTITTYIRLGFAGGMAFGLAFILGYATGTIFYEDVLSRLYW